MLRRFCDELAPGARVLWGSCDPLSTPRPLGPFVDVARLTGGELGDLVERDALPHEVAAALLDELAATVPTVLVIEDAHWADEGTLDVLRLLGRRVRGKPGLVIATYRDDSLDRSHPLRVVLGELASSDVGARLRLQPLSLDAVARLAEPHDIDAGDLYRNTAGNPFFVSEVLAAGQGEIPETVRDAVLARASRLSPRARTVLDAASVSSLSTELWLLEALTGEAIDSVSECVDSGMLTPHGGGVAFRHELARIAIEESLSPHRRLRLHQGALAALVERPAESVDAARVTHHAVAAGDAEAVLRFAPVAARRATSLGAYREAAAQYAAALRFGERLPPAEHAELLELRSRACYLTDQYDEGIASLEQALEVHRALGDTLRQGDALRRLSNFLWCPGRIAESERSARAAVALLEESPPGRELAAAYANLAWLCGCGMRTEEAVAWAGRAIELATCFDAKEIDIDAHTTIGACQDYNQLEQSLERARKVGTDEQVGRIFIPLAAIAVETRRHALATRYLDAGIAYCSERGYELFRLYLLAYRARLELDQGRWSEAADSAASVVRIRRTSTTPRIQALVVLGLLRARRGDPGQWDALDEAWALAEPTGELPRIAPVAAARAEAAWLEGDGAAAARATTGALALAVERAAGWRAGELAVWRRRAGLAEQSPPVVDGPFALELAGRAQAAAERWTELGGPYEAALALAAADDEDLLRRSFDEFQRLGAQPAAVIVARRLRERGARGVPRGPRPATRENPAQLTTRELDVLALVAEGLRNSDIAERLFVSRKTVDHHVSAILRKLDVRTRGEAGAEAVRLGLAPR
jgi:DNA-binding CsgD family transcriptional regulator/tetratricopeptide (TPR) repeat protein